MIPLLHSASVEQLRERALGDGWRKLVVDGVTATPVSLRRGAGREGRRRAAHRDRAARASGRRGSTRCSNRARNVHLLAPDGDVHARRTKKGRWLVSRGKPSSHAAATTTHDRARSHAAAGRPSALQGDEDRPRQGAAGAALRRALRSLPIWERDRIRVVDAGCGKAYMSLALVAYGREVGTRVELVGLDTNPRRDRRRCRRSPTSLGYDEARFEATAIAAYESDEPIDLLVSLHACDTATDEAIAAGVRLGADAIVVAPCCHHELAAQIARARQGRAATPRAPARPPGRPRHRRAARGGARDARLPRRGDRVRLGRAHGEERDAARAARAVDGAGRPGPPPSTRSCARRGASTRRSGGSDCPYPCAREIRFPVRKGGN